MKKLFTGLLGLILVLGLILTGCSSKQKNTDDIQAFFKAFNHLLESKSLHLEGSLDFNGATTPVDLWYDSQDGLEAAFVTSLDDDMPVEFYIKDGGTYLDFAGTRSSSTLANLGLDNSASLAGLNPFLDLSTDERLALIDSTSQNKDVHTLVLNTTELSKAIDSYGSAKISKAEISYTLKDNEISWLSFALEGTSELTQTPTDLNLTIDLTVHARNEKLNIPFPADLASWPRG